MERQVLSKRIGEILDDISRLSNALYAMDSTDIQRYPDNYEVLSTDAALRSERIACRMRHLLYASTGIKKSEYLRSAGVMHEIQVEYQNGVMEITLPCLLPKRKQRQNSEFLIDPIHFTLSKYAESNPMPTFSHCVVCFSHIYDRSLSTRRMRDYDNYELKQILDMISAFIMVDDGSLLCDAYNTTELGDRDCTCISIMDQERFLSWLEERKNRLESITDFGV